MRKSSLASSMTREFKFLLISFIFRFLTLECYLVAYLQQGSDSFAWYLDLVIKAKQFNSDYISNMAYKTDFL